MFCRFQGIGPSILASQLRFIVMRSAGFYDILADVFPRPIRLSVTAAALAAASLPAAAAPKETGIWIDDTGTGAVKIEICHETTLCGYIVWIKEPLKSNGKPLTDELNPSPSKRSRPICGLQVLGDLEQMSEGGFDNGWVYDPKRGAQFSVALDLLSPNKLQVTGYKGMRMFGQSFIWTRAPADLPSCTSNEASAPDAADKKKPATKTAKAEKHKSSKVSSGEAAASRPRKTASEAE
jgi:uncharacterized protein (DUF2147 family)